jgi:zinc-binding in reverse transcriptase
MNMTMWWDLKIPLKIKVFMWLVGKNIILTKVYLAKRSWSGNHSCSFCDEEETVDHLFVTCPMVKSVVLDGICQDLFSHWHNLHDFANMLVHYQGQRDVPFLMY